MLDPSDRRIFENMNRTLEDIAKSLKMMTRLSVMESNKRKLRAEALAEVEQKDVLSYF